MRAVLYWDMVEAFLLLSLKRPARKLITKSRSILLKYVVLLLANSMNSFHFLSYSLDEEEKARIGTYWETRTDGRRLFCIIICLFFCAKVPENIENLKKKKTIKL